MEKLKNLNNLQKRALIVALIMVVGGLLVAFTKKEETEGKTEEWMMEMLPETVGEYEMIKSFQHPGASYRMDQSSYDMLLPYGIVARIYKKDSVEYDVVVIASRSKDSFHDPRICFSAQQWVLDTMTTHYVETETRGTVPITITEMTAPGREGTIAAFFYRGQGRFYGNTKSLKWGMFWEQVKGGSDLDGAFYRFIPKERNPDVEKLKQFIGEYLDAANESSDGYF